MVSAHARAVARAAVAAVGRDEHTRILATLTRRFGDLDLAEDMMQEAFDQALRTWAESGVPDSPVAWLQVTARRKALDAVRRDEVLARTLRHLTPRSAEESGTAADPADLVAQADAAAIGDDRLGLIFACAHPLFTPEDRIALTLRFVAGLSTAEVAHGLLMPVTTLQQRIVRAKKRIRVLGISFEPPRPEQRAERIAGVQRVIYLLYSEGFARSTGEAHVRDDLTGEAIRLARLMRELMPGSAETAGLLGLLLLTEARRPARIDAQGQPVPLECQDRTRWNRELIDEGLALAEAAAAAPGAGSLAIQASLAAVHAEASDFDDTDWAQIAVLYRLLESYEPGPVVRLGGAVAYGRAHGPAEGLRRLDGLASDASLDRYRPFHIARAVTLEELGDASGAAAAYREALQIPGNRAEGEFLQAALAGLADSDLLGPFEDSAKP